MKTFFKKLDYHFLVETTKIENTSFPLETALSEVNVKTNRMESTKWTYQKEWSFASNYFIFLENLFQFQSLLNRVNVMYQRPKCPYSYFQQALSLILECFFPVKILKLQRAFDAHSNGRPCYFIKRLAPSVYKEISGASVY